MTIGDIMPLVANGPFTQASLKISVQGYDYTGPVPIERPIVLNLRWAATAPASNYKEHYHGVTPAEMTWSTHIHTRGQGREAYATGTFDGVAVESVEATLYQNRFTDIAVFRS